MTVDADRLAFAWEGLAEIEPRHIPTLDRICGQLSTLLYAWLARIVTEDLRSAADIATAVKSIGNVARPAPHPPNSPWPPRTIGNRYPWLFLIGWLGQTIWNCPEAARDHIAANYGGSDHFYRTTVITVLAALFPGDLNVHGLFRRAVDDPEGCCRGAALRALAQHFRDDHETEALLRARAVDDPDGYCRGAALQALAQHFRDDQETKALLRARAVDDKGGGPLGAALQALVQHFRDDYESKALLRARAVDDKEGGPRSAALQALAQHFRDDPHTKPLLHARAVDDPDGYCRGAALLGFAQMLDVPELKELASRYLDGRGLGRDPLEPVTSDDIAKAAVKLGKSEKEIRALYQRLSAEVPWIFTGNGQRAPTSRRPRRADRPGANRS